MKRHSERIVVNFDPDPAGAAATERSIQMLLDGGMHVRVLELEAGLDPDEFIRKYGADVYADRLNRASGYFTWLADRARQKYGSATAEARMSGYEALLLPAIRRLSDRLERAAVATEVADYLGLDKNLVLAEFRRMGGSRTAETAKQAEIPLRERVLIRSLMVNPEIRFLLDILSGSRTAQAFRVWPLIAAIAALHQQDHAFRYEALEERLEEGEQKRLLHFIVFADKSSEVFTGEQAALFAQQLESEDFEVTCNDLKRRIQEAQKAGDLVEGLRLTREFDEMRRAGRASIG
jgi:DNA primase